MPGQFSIADIQAAPATGSGQFSSADLAPAGAQPFEDPLQHLLNYHTGNNWVDAPMGLLQGAGKGLMSTAAGIDALTEKAGLASAHLDPEYVRSVTQPQGIGQGTGKFLEQAAEFAIPDAAAGDALKGAGLIARLAARGATAAGVAGAQTGGNPEAMATAGLLGAGAEVGGAALKTARELASQKAPTLRNYFDSFAATPAQKPVIGRATVILKRDGVLPTGSPAEMQTAIKNQLATLGEKYDALDPKIGNRKISAKGVIRNLKAQQAAYTHGAQTATTEVPTGLVDEAGNPISRTETTKTPFVSNANRAAYQQLQSELDDVQTLAKTHGGKLTFDDLKYLRDGANGRTNFLSPKAERNLYDSVGNVYRKAMDLIAPQTTKLNRDYATYKSLESIADENVGMARGTTPTAFEQALGRHTGREIGAAVGAGAGHVTGIPGAPWIGAGIGAIAWPKLAEPVARALENASERGALESLQRLNPARWQLLRQALRIGDSRIALKILDKMPTGVAQVAAQHAVSQ